MSTQDTRFEDEGMPDPGGTADGAIDSGQLDGAMEPAHDRPMGVEEFGTTEAELRDGEPLEGRLARETPDVIDLVDTPADESVGERPVGRIVEPDEGARSDTDKELLGTDVGVDHGGFSAEEAAMHVEPEA